MELPYGHATADLRDREGNTLEKARKQACSIFRKIRYPV
jgi:hypothetical protein